MTKVKALCLFIIAPMWNSPSIHSFSTIYPGLEVSCSVLWDWPYVDTIWEGWLCSAAAVTGGRLTPMMGVAAVSFAKKVVFLPWYVVTCINWLVGWLSLSVSRVIFKSSESLFMKLDVILGHDPGKNVMMTSTKLRNVRKRFETLLAQDWHLVAETVPAAIKCLNKTPFPPNTLSIMLLKSRQSFTIFKYSYKMLLISLGLDWFL